MQYPNYPSETPAQVEVADDFWDYERRVAEIPMRDGVQLHTVILVPKGAARAPILLTRTPYDADAMTERNASAAPRAGASTATTTRPTWSSTAATSASSRTCAASTAPRATTS